MNTPRWIRPRRILGKTLSLRSAEIADAAFILSLRTDENKARYMSPTRPDLAAQERYLELYQQSDNGLYFIIETLEGEALGTVRLYDAQGDSFCWGSWILRDGAPAAAAIESVLMLFNYALQYLGFTRAHCQVRKDNNRVWAFHERFGAKRTRESEDEYEYRITPEAIAASLKRYAKYLPDPIVVEYDERPVS